MMRTPHRARGFTLIELMVSVTLGMLIVIALVMLLANVSRNNSELSSSSRSIESGRFTLQILAADVSHAGYWGGFLPQFDDLSLATTSSPNDVPDGMPDPCLGFAGWTDTATNPNYMNNLIGVPVQGWTLPYDSGVAAQASVYCSSVVANPYATAAVTNDVLVVRHLEPCQVGTGSDDCADTRAAASPHAYMQVSHCSRDTSSYVLGTSGFTLHSGTSAQCPTDTSVALPGTGTAPIRRFSSSIYYVRNYATTAPVGSTPGDGVPTLVRSRFGVSATGTSGNAPSFQPAQALVENVEGFRVEYALDTISKSGVDLTSAVSPNRMMDPVNWLSTTTLTTPQNRGNGLPDIYVHCAQASGAVVCTNVATGATVANKEMMHAVAVKIYALVRGEKTSNGYVDTKKYCLASSCSVAADYMGPFNDGYKRHLFTQTIRLTNISGRREVPN
jgi:type IV pilus assembly protein PilW